MVSSKNVFTLQTSVPGADIGFEIIPMVWSSVSAARSCVTVRVVEPHPEMVIRMPIRIIKSLVRLKSVMIVLQ